MERVFDKTREKRLGKILGGIGVCAPAADIRDNRGTISTAKALHRLPRAGVVFAGFEDKTPTRRLELTQSTPPRGWVPENGAKKSLNVTDKARMPGAGDKSWKKKRPASAGRVLKQPLGRVRTYFAATTPED